MLNNWPKEEIELKIIDIVTLLWVDFGSTNSNFKHKNKQKDKKN